jgi:hypothetical protein
MLRRHASKDMMRAHVRMSKIEYQKVMDLSGNLSINEFLMTGIRKLISDAELERNKKESLSGLTLSGASPSATPAQDSTFLRVTKGDDESIG